MQGYVFLLAIVATVSFAWPGFSVISLGESPRWCFSISSAFWPVIPIHSGRKYAIAMNASVINAKNPTRTQIISIMFSKI